MRRRDAALGWYSWPEVIDAAEHLSRLATAAADRTVSVSVDSMLGAEGIAIALSGGDWHVIVAASATPSEAEGTVLHEVAHLLLAHVGDESYDCRMRLDAAGSTDLHRAPEELAADALGVALAIRLEGVLAEPVDEVVGVLELDAARF